MGLGIWLILLSSSAVLLLASNPTLSAEALTQTDIDGTILELEKVQSKIDNVEKSITSKDQTIKELYKQRDTLHQLYQSLESQKLQSWDALERIGPTKTELDNIINTIHAESKQLGTLYLTKTNLIGNMESLQSKLEQQNYIYSIINRPLSDYSTTKHIGIVLSDTCVNMIKNNIPNNCPDPHDLMDLDTSIKSISGYFDDDGFRIEPPLRNSWRLYDTDDTPRIFWDPPKGMAERIKLIKIESKLPEYFLIENMSLDNGIRTWNEKRYVENCRQATISGEDWQMLLPDTIFLFHNKCKSSDFNEVKFETMPFTNLPLDQTQYWKDKVWLEESKERCKGLCFEY